jgi:NhaP-type Na+/H+ or K+/H+ antiporter
VGLFASLIVWTVFGALFVGPVLTTGIDATAVAYAVLSLTVIRMVPVAISLLGLGLRRDTVALMGWFGPRGLASVVFSLVAVEALNRSGAAFDAIVEVATWTILLSVMAHGLTAGPLARAYGRRMKGAGNVPELMDAPEPRVRRRHLGAAKSA